MIESLYIFAILILFRLNSYSILFQLLAISLKCVQAWLYLVNTFCLLDDSTNTGKRSLGFPHTILNLKHMLIYLVKRCNASQFVNSFYNRLCLGHTDEN